MHMPFAHFIALALCDYSDARSSMALARLKVLGDGSSTCHHFSSAPERVSCLLDFSGDIKKAKDGGFHTCQSLMMVTKKVKRHAALALTSPC